MTKFYSKTHEWIELNETVATVGITVYAQQELGEVVYIQLPRIHSFINAGEEIAVLESTKAASDLYSPVTGEVLQVNEALASNPSLINQDPEGKGWIFQIKMQNLKEVSSFMKQEEYLKMIK